MTGQSSARHRTTQFIKAENKNTDQLAPPEWNWAGMDKPVRCSAAFVSTKRLLHSTNWQRTCWS